MCFTEIYLPIIKHYAVHMVTLNKIIVGNSWKCSFRACNFREADRLSEHINTLTTRSM
jgi:hypothetical protein